MSRPPWFWPRIAAWMDGAVPTESMPAERMTRITAIVPYRENPAGKSRLAPLLTHDARRRLAQAMLADVLAVLEGARGIESILLVGDAPGGSSGGSKLSVLVSDAALNSALELAAARAFEAGAEAVCIVHADAPLLGAAELDEFLSAAAGSDAVHIAPCERDEGTTLLCVPRAAGIAFAYGADSFQRHRAAYAARGVAVEVHGRVPDVDLPADLTALREALQRSPELAPHTRAALCRRT